MCSWARFLRLGCGGLSGGSDASERPVSTFANVVTLTDSVGDWYDNALANFMNGSNGVSRHGCIHAKLTALSRVQII